MNKASYVHQLFSSLADHYDLLNSLLTLNRDKQWRKFTASLAELKPQGIALDVATGTGELALELARKMTGKRRAVKPFHLTASKEGEVKTHPHLASPVKGEGLRVFSPGASQRSEAPLANSLPLSWEGEGDKGGEVYNQPQVIGIDFCPKMLEKARDKVKRQGYEGAVEFVLGRAENLPFPDSVFDCAAIGFALRNVADIKATFQEMCRVVKSGGKVISLKLTHPRNGLWRRLYYFYLFRIAPFLGGLISGKKEAYTYLPYSLLDFPSSQKIKQIMEEAGLNSIHIHYLTLAVVAVHIGSKE